MEALTIVSEQIPEEYEEVVIATGGLLRQEAQGSSPTGLPDANAQYYYTTGPSSEPV